MENIPKNKNKTISACFCVCVKSKKKNFSTWTILSGNDGTKAYEKIKIKQKAEERIYCARENELTRRFILIKSTKKYQVEQTETYVWAKWSIYVHLISLEYTF